MKFKKITQKKRGKLNDLFVVFATAGITYTASIHFNIIEKIHYLSGIENKQNIEELIFSSAILGGGLLFSYYREKKRKENSFIMDLVNSSPDMIVTLNKNLDIEYVSQATEHMLGYTKDEFASIPIDKHMTTESYQKVKKAIENYYLIKEQKGVHDETISFKRLDYYHKDGRIIPIALQTKPFIRNKQVLYIINTGRDISYRIKIQKELENLNKELKEHTITDELTGLSNRKCFNQKFHETIEYAKRYDEARGLLYIDIDNFKKVNDIYGHTIGDELLKNIAMRLKKNVRKTDLTFRLGGDEFAVILNDGKIYEYETVIKRLKSELDRPYEISNARVACTSASIGKSVFPNDTTDLEKMIEIADNAMYEQKNILYS